MPHVSSGSGGDDLGSTDEVKVFKDEGDDEDEKRSSEVLNDEKNSLIDLTENEEKSGGSFSSKHVSRPDHSPVFGRLDPTPHTSSFNMGYLVSPYGYANGATGAVSMARGLGPGSHPGALPFFVNGDHIPAQPPPAHMGIPPYQLDAKTAGMGLTRPPMYPFSTGQYPYPVLSADMPQWHTPSMYPISTAATGFRSPYPTSLPIPTSLPSDFYRFSPGLMPPHPGLSPHSHHLASHPAIVTPGPKQDLSHSIENHKFPRSLDQKNSSMDNNKEVKEMKDIKDKKPHIKKPLNAFMLYMKEMRAKVVAECTLKESAAINQILGRRWHALGREEQAKYYEMARRERQLHMQLYPDWSSRANASRGKKRKRKQETSEGGNSLKKCRARYGLDQQNQWCKPCRRKKKCIRYLGAGDSKHSGDKGNASDDNMGGGDGTGSSASESLLRDNDDNGSSLTQSLSSPGGLSGLSSLTSPSMILPSPSTSLASPSVVSLASPCMSLQSPLTPLDSAFEKTQQLLLPATNSLILASHFNHHSINSNSNNPSSRHQSSESSQGSPRSLPMHRSPVGTNPHDINNPLSVNQLTRQFKNTSSSSSSGSSFNTNILSPLSINQINQFREAINGGVNGFDSALVNGSTTQTSATATSTVTGTTSNLSNPLNQLAEQLRISSSTSLGTDKGSSALPNVHSPFMPLGLSHLNNQYFAVKTSTSTSVSGTGVSGSATTTLTNSLPVVVKSEPNEQVTSRPVISVT